MMDLWQLNAPLVLGRGGPGFVGYANNNTGNPTFPAHEPGDLIINSIIRANNTLPDLPSDYTDWAAESGSQANNGLSSRLVWKIAENSSETISWSAGDVGRSVWIFRNAQIGVNGFENDIGAGADWKSLTLTEPSFVCVYASKSSTQADISSALPAGTWREGGATKNGNLSYLSRISADLLTSFAPAATTFDNSSGTHQLCAFSVRAA